MILKSRLLNIFPPVLFLIFLIALTIRFLYFPQNIYFAYDQARDSFFALNILKGDLRLIGPPSAASTSLFPGPLSLYTYAFVYKIFGPSPETLSIFFRIYNALGIFLVFLIGKKLFNKEAGLLAALLFAVSYEQTQYSLFMSHQPLAILPVLIFYLGLTMLFFEKREPGLVITALGLGLAMQFHFVYFLLVPVTAFIFIFLRPSIPKLSIKHYLSALGVFILTTLSYIIAEIKFGFRFFNITTNTAKSLSLHFLEGYHALSRFIHDMFIHDYNYVPYVVILIFLLFILYLKSKSLRPQALFLLLWLLGGILPYLFSGTTSYYYSAGASVSLAILVSSFLLMTSSRNSTAGVSFSKDDISGSIHPQVNTQGSLETVIKPKLNALKIVIILMIVFNNYSLIKSQNPNGPNTDMVIQPGMIINQEKRVIDFIYQSGGGQPFAVSALSIPLNVYTTWSYLFEWYGKEKYNYLPTWVGKPAEGFPGNLAYETDRSKLPNNIFVIIEPTIGIPKHEINSFFQEESYFTKLVEEKEFGTIKVQKRVKY